MSAGEVDEVAAAAAKMKADEEAAYFAKIMKGRERGDYCNNFFGQMRMTSLESFHIRSCKELQDFQQFFKITANYRKAILCSEKPNGKRTQFLEQCFMNGIVEEEVIHYDEMLQKRVTDIEQTIDKYFKLVQPAITQSKTDKMMRDIEKTMNKPAF